MTGIAYDSTSTGTAIGPTATSTPSGGIFGVITIPGSKNCLTEEKKYININTCWSIYYSFKQSSSSKSIFKCKFSYTITKCIYWFYCSINNNYNKIIIV